MQTKKETCHYVKPNPNRHHVRKRALCIMKNVITVEEEEEQSCEIKQMLARSCGCFDIGAKNFQLLTRPTMSKWAKQYEPEPGVCIFTSSLTLITSSLTFSLVCRMIVSSYV